MHKKSGRLIPTALHTYDPIQEIITESLDCVLFIYDSSSTPHEEVKD